MPTATSWSPHAAMSRISPCRETFDWRLSLKNVGRVVPTHGNRHMRGARERARQHFGTMHIHRSGPALLLDSSGSCLARSTHWILQSRLVFLVTQCFSSLKRILSSPSPAMIGFDHACVCVWRSGVKPHNVFASLSCGVSLFHRICSASAQARACITRALLGAPMQSLPESC